MRLKKSRYFDSGAITVRCVQVTRATSGMEDEEDNGDFIERLARQLREKPVSTFIPASLRRSCDDSTTTGDSTNADSSPNCFYHPTNNLKENTATSFTKKPLVEIDSSGNPIPYPSSNEVFLGSIVNFEKKLLFGCRGKNSYTNDLLI